MQEIIEVYTQPEVVKMLGVSDSVVRMRIRRGWYPIAASESRVVGVLKDGFWRACIERERVGLIIPDKMPQAYRDERKKYAGDMVYNDVLRGRFEK